MKLFQRHVRKPKSYIQYESEYLANIEKLAATTQTVKSEPVR